MNASKENARRASAIADQIQKSGSYAVKHVDLEWLVAFLAAAERKLPSEAAYKREKERKRLYGKKKAEAGA